MARIRSIKPEFCVSEQLAECSPNARLTFALMWMFCDDNGIHPAKYKTLKGEVYPLDEDITSDDVKTWVRQLVTHGLLREYQVGSDAYWIVTGWKKHQKIDKPSRKYPPPLDEDSPNAPRIIDDASPPEGKGGEGSRMESSNPSQAKGSVLTPAPAREDPQLAALVALCAQHRVRVDTKARMHLEQLLREGMTLEELEQAIAIARERKPDPELLYLRYLAPIVIDVKRGIAKPQGLRGGAAADAVIARMEARELALMREAAQPP